MSRLATLSPAYARPAGNGLARGALGVVLGAGFTVALFLGMALFDSHEPAKPPPDIAELRAAAIHEPPPPPPEIQRREDTAVADTLTGIETLASESPVHVTVPPPDIAALLPPPPAAPPASIQVGRLYADLKPKIDDGDMQDRIYQMAEVDQLPRVLNRVNPVVPPSVRNEAKMLRTSMLFTVDANGEIKNVRVVGSSGNPKFDEIMVETIYHWTFSAAVRRGKKVRVLLQQAVTVKWNQASPFIAN